MEHLTDDEIDAAALYQLHDAVEKLEHLFECDECFENYKSTLEFIAALRLHLGLSPVHPQLASLITF
jgi:hypothetical protein